MGESLKDPVCGREVRSFEISMVFMGVEYGFCSLECRNRFLAFPDLYAGLRGQRSPRQTGRRVRRCWHLWLAAPLSAEQGARVIEAIKALPGIVTVDVGGSRIDIVLDLVRAEIGQLEARLVEAGAQLGEGWAERLRQGMQHCLEGCAGDAEPDVPGQRSSIGQGQH